MLIVDSLIHLWAGTTLPPHRADPSGLRHAGD